jgi:hypothetical protein
MILNGKTLTIFPKLLIFKYLKRFRAPKRSTGNPPSEMKSYAFGGFRRVPPSDPYPKIGFQRGCRSLPPVSQTWSLSRGPVARSSHERIEHEKNEFSSLALHPNRGCASPPGATPHLTKPPPPPSPPPPTPPPQHPPPHTPPHLTPTLTTTPTRPHPTSPQPPLTPAAPTRPNCFSPTHPDKVET